MTRICRDKSNWASIRLSALAILILFQGWHSPAWAANPDAGTQTPTDIATEANLRTDVQIVYTGGSMGIGSGHYGFQVPWSLNRALSAVKGKVESVAAFHGCLAQGPYILVSEDRRVPSLLKFLSGGPVTCEEPTAGLSLILRREVLLLGTLGDERSWLDSSELSKAKQAPIHIRKCHNAKGGQATLFGPSFDSFEPESWELEHFEFRLAIQIQFRVGDQRFEATSVGLPSQEASRRFKVLSELIGASDTTLFVDAGNFVDGASSVKDGVLSLHRPLGFEMLRRLNAAVLVPGETELAAGPTAFLKEAQKAKLHYVASNWKTKNKNLVLPRYILKTVPSQHGPVRLAFLGVIDPSILNWVPGIELEGVQLEDPVEAVEGLIDELQRLDQPPDSILLLTAAGPNTLRKLKALEGLDLILGDVHSQTERIQTAQYTVREHADNPVVATLPVDGISVTTLRFRKSPPGWALHSFELKPTPVPANTPSDPSVRAAVTTTRSKVYPALDQPLLPAPAPTEILKHGPWTSIACEAVREFTNADIVLLPELPEPPRIPGPLTELLAVDRLATLDRLEIHYVAGDRIVRLLREIKDVVPTACGGQLGVLKPKIRGRVADPDRVYRVVTTDRARVTFLSNHLKTAHSQYLLGRSQGPIRGLLGEHITFRGAVLRTLRDLRDRYTNETPEQLYARLIRPTVTTKTPQWLFRISRLAVRLENFQGAENSVFATVPETLATSPSSLNLGIDTDISLAYNEADVWWDVRLRSNFNRLSVTGLDDQELTDDLRLSSAFTYAGWSFQPLPGVTKSLRFMPFSELLYDSEITPVQGAERQSDLLLEVGLGAKRLGAMRTLRFGGFVLQDLSQLERNIEYGGRLEMNTLHVIGPKIRFTTGLDATVYGSTPDDDASDLRYKVKVEARFALPLARYLDISLFGQAFAFGGRIPENDVLGLSYTMGFALDVRTAMVVP